MRAEVLDSHFRAQLTPPPGADCPNAAILAGSCTNYFGYGDEPGFYENSTDHQQYLNRNVETYSAVIGWNLGAVDLTSVTSYENAELAMREDTDASPLRLLEVDQSVNSHNVRAGSTPVVQSRWTERQPLAPSISMKN